MDLEDFESQYRQKINELIGQLQTAVILKTQLEAQLIAIGNNMQAITQIVEEYIKQKRLE